MAAFLLFLVTAAQAAIPLNSATYSADEDCRWAVAGEAETAGNAWYIAGPKAPGDREAWLAALRQYREEMRHRVHELRQVEVAFQGVRAWVRMRADLARTVDLAPGERFRADVEARWIEGNGELVLALDLMDRGSGAWRGWSGAFSTLQVPRDGAWRRLTWEGTLPDFDQGAYWVKLILGMDATYDPTPGRVEVRNFALDLPDRGTKLSPPAASPALNRALYDRPDLLWASRAFVCHFTFLYDLSFYDPANGGYRVAQFLDDGERDFGGYDAVVLWHAYPRIGVDERNQFDFYRDMPGGLTGLRRVVQRLHRRGVKVFIDYNPWDTGTRREDCPDEEAIARMLAALGADGVFLDTMTAGSARLREVVDRARRGVVFEPEGSPPPEQLEVCSASWAQGLPDLPEPGLLRLKWIEPRHMQHQISRWAGSLSRELENAFFNGSGVLVWENVFGTWNPWSEEDQATLRRMAPILRAFAPNFASEAWQPMAPTLVPGVYANEWPGEEGTIWTILNRTGRVVTGPILRVPARKGECFVDLWNGRSLAALPPPSGGSESVVEVSVPLGPIGCVATVRCGHRDKGQSLLRSLRSQSGTVPNGRRTEATSVIDPLPVAPSPRAPADRTPPGMVLVPAGEVTMNLVHQRRECGCYPDPGTPPGQWRSFLWGAPFNGTIEHHIGPLPLPAFFIDEHEVTNADFARFLKESGHRPRDARSFLKHRGTTGSSPPAPLLKERGARQLRSPRAGLPSPSGEGLGVRMDHPVVYVDLEDARAYARWAGKRLPTEAEWHRAAQSDDGRKWPWGEEFDATKCNGTGKGTTPVAAYPQGRSPFGCYDMAGNVWEWTESERSDGHTRFCIIRGGSYYRAEGSVWYVEGGPQPITSHTKFILMYPGLDRCRTVGFRCVKDIATPERPGQQDRQDGAG